MSGTIIGRVVHIKGAVEVRDLQGVIKLLSLGDDVHKGDLVQTGANAELIIDFLNGKRLELAESSEALLDESVHRGQEFGNSELFADIEAVQKALLDGTLDIDDLPPTAAGPEQGGIELGDGLSEAIVHTREAREGSVDVRLRGIEFDAETAPGLIDLGSDSVAEPFVASSTSVPGSATTTTSPAPAVVAIADAAAISEDAAVLTLNANVLGNDVLASGSPLSVVAVNGSTAAVGNVVAGAFGTFTIDADGSYTYALDNAHASVQGLADGEILTDTVSYSAQNSAGSTDTASITITVHGNEDAPTITGTSSGSIGEDAIVNISGSLIANDVDAIDTPVIIAQPGTVGSYGTFTVNAAGVWTYTVNNAAAQTLGATDNVTETFTVTASTADGETATMTISVNVAGSDDLPIISTDSGVVTEGTAPSTTGTLTATDADDPTLEFVAETIAGAYGDFTVQTDGGWTYVLNSNAEALISGQVENETLTVTLTDGSTTTVAITVTGSNDVPVASAAVNAVDEDASISGNVSATDDDAGETATLTYALTGAAPTGLTFNADGTYSFDASSYDSLVDGEDLVLTIPFTASDATSTSTPENLVITVTGTNDVPVASAAVNAVDEDASVTGSVAATDADAGETATLTYALTGAAPTGLTFNTDGTYTFDASSYDSLVDGEDLVLTIPFTASDATSTSTRENLVITVTGTNDVPVANAAVNVVDEDATITGNVSATDDDAGETATLTYALTGAAPTGLTFNADGSYSFDASSYDSLADGEDLVLTIPFTASDATSTSAPQNLVITVTGTNDGPIATDSSHTVAEDSLNVALNLPLPTDADASDILTVTIRSLPDAALGSVTLSGGAALSIDQVISLTEFQSLEFDTVPDATGVGGFTYEVNDGIATASGTATITVSGDNDSPIAVDNSYDTDEESTFSGNVLTNDTGDGVDSDADGDTLSVSALNGVNGDIGSAVILASGATVTLQSDGSFSYDASTSATFNALAAGDTATDSFTYTITDGNGASDIASVTMTITGTNDVPVANAAVNAVDEDASVSGSVVATDADAGETATLTYALTGAAPTGLTFNTDGTYTFDASSYDSLVDGEDLVLSIPFTASDATSTSTPENLLITVTGTNDVPVASAAVNAVDEDASVTGSVVATDADAGETATLTYALTGAAPTGLTFNTDGTYTFDASSYDSLVEGEDLVLSIPFTASDATSTSTPENLLITVTGTNDVPVASAAVNAVDEDASVTGSVVATDADAGETATLTYALTGAAPTGLTFNTDGTYTFDASSYDSLVDGEDLVLTIPFTASDATSTSTPENLLITVTGTNDVPVANAAVNAVDEDASVTGSVVATDADAGETATLTYALTGAAPTGLTFNADGTYSFDASSYDSLVEGEDLVLTIPFTASDATSTSTRENLVITVTGTNDVPVANAALNAVDEDATITGNVSATDDDAGETATLTYALTGAAPTGLTFNADGSYSFDASSYDSLADGEDLVLTIPFTASDATSTSAPQNLVITVTGTNDGPIATDSSHTVAEDSLNVALNLPLPTDADASDILTVTIRSLPDAALGSVTLSGGAALSIDQVISLTEFQSLEFDTVPDATGVGGFTYEVNDGIATASGTATITVSGDNDSPIAVDNSYDTDEESTFSGNVLTNDTGDGVDSDADGDTLSVSALNGVNGDIGSAVILASGATVTLQSDGSFSYDASTSATFNALAAGDTATDSFTYTITDGNGASDIASVTMTITGTNDVPVANAAVNAVDEDASVTGSVVATDADAGETATLTYALTGAAPTGLTFNADGTYTFDASSYDSLVDGEDLVLTIPFTASDATSTSTPENLVITVTGTNDVPVASAAVNAVDEDASVTGSVVATDADAGETATLTYALTGAAPTGLTFNTDGTYTFDASSYDSLVDGEDLVLSIPFTASDATSTSTPESLVITVTGTNDVPVASAAVNAVDEDASVTGSVVATDADAGETATLTYALTGAAPTGLTFNTDGTYTFDASSYDSLVDGEDLVLSIPFTASDATSTSTPENLLITVTGTNDVPVASAAVNAVDEDASVTGSVVATDADAGETATLTYALTGAAPTGLTFNTDGTYTFDASSYDSLVDGEDLVLSIPFTASDATSTSTPENLLITVTGTNDVPVASAAVNAVDEDASVTGSVVATDADAGETATLTYALTGAAPTGLTFNTDGTYTFDASSYDSLVDGEDLVLSIPFTASDATSTSTPENLLITVTGTNDVPVANAAVNAVDEDASVTGSVVATDADAGETATLTYALTGAAPTGLTFNADGTYTFDASSYDSLVEGDDLVLTIPFTASDATSTSTPENLLITVTGTNDVPVASAAVNAVDEDASVTGSVVATDADAGETATLTYALTGAAPTGLTFNTDGTYTFDASSYDSLVDGEDLVLSIPFTASDATSTSTPENLVITVTGTNDVPVASAAVNAVDEDASVTGSVVATDADAGETATLTYALTGAAPTGLTFNADGTYSFDASSYDSLVEGEDLVLTIPFTASDATSTSTPENLLITVTGTNDVPVANAAVNAVDEDASVTGSVVATDADAGETATLTYALTGAAPTGLTFNADGTYTFDASSYDSLVEGDDLVLTIPFTASDATSTSTPENLVITVTGTNDVPVASAAVNAVDEDASVTGSVVATDADAGETATLTYALTGAAPTGLTFNTDGTYTFDASSYDSLVEGDDLVLSIPFTASDATSTSTPENLVITVTGTNDVPVANAAVNAVDEDASVTGSVVATDADAGETATLTYALTGAAPTGLTFNTDGTYTFDASSYDSLVDGEDLVLSIPFTASDATSTSTPENLLITVTGTNDVPVANAAVNAVDEDASVTGSVVATDADAGETATLTYALTGAAPTGLTFNADGTYTFDASSYDSLVDGEDLVLTIPFTASDATSTSTPENLLITVTGTNDVPVASAAVNAVDEDASVTGSVVATDADAGETATLTYALTGAAPTGLTFNADGTYTFDASSYDSLVDGEDLVLTIPFTASDATSTSTPENLVITVTGTNDVPVASAAVNAVDEDASVTGSVVATDADAGETATLTYALTGAAPTGLTFNADGTYTFDASSYDSLVDGEDLVLSIPFTASDATSTSTPENLLITVTGTNDVPVASAAVNAVDEDASVTGSVVATDADAGETATLTYALTGAAPTGLTFNTDGTYTFDASSYDSLVEGDDLVLSIPFTASDATSTSTPENLLITVTGTNDVPVANAAVNAVDEDASVTGSVVATDADAGETATLTYALTGAAPTGLTFNTDGTYTFDASSYDSLVEGDDLVLSIPFTASDATSTSTPENLLITVTGTNDVPVASAAVNAVDEDASVTGSVVATDADAGETATLTYALTGAAPTGLTFNTDGTYTFDASSYDSLVEGDDLVLSIPFTASDATSTSTPENLLITVTGTNDVPVASAAVNAVDEDASVTGSVVATDADAGETATLTYALTGAAPTGLTFNTDGTYTFDASSYDSLVEGEDLVLTIPFTASDATSTSTPENLLITVTGTNDVPVASAAVNAVDEDASVTGSVVATDADAGETATLTYALTGAAPTGLTFNTDGTYTFDASSYDSLVEGEDLVLTIPFTASDATSTSTPENLLITVTGTNDVPVASAAVNAVDEDASVTGSVVATDADVGETATLTYALTGAAPTGLTFNTDGTYTFDASSYDSLVEGEDLVLTIPFTASDATSTSTPENLVITVTGTNDVPVANAAVNAVDEDASVTGSVVATDADVGETATLTYALTGAAPTGLTFNTDGTYTFDASSYDSLVEGDDLVLSIPFTASDATSTSTPENLVITVTGTNDVPVASAAVNAVDEDASVTGSVVATDADAGETATLTYALTGAAPTGLTFNTDGTYTFDASSYDSLVEGDDLVLSIPFTASDATSTSTPENLLITVTGTNDVPVASAAVNAVDEDASVTGSVVATDADAGETATLTYALTGAAPTGLTFNTDGTYTFDASSYDSLVEGEDLVLTIPFTASDATSTSTPENLLITVTGTNDVPVASAAVNAVDEDASVSGSVVATDADAGETATLTYALTGAAPTGLTFNTDGTYTFDASSYDSLVEGDDLVLTIPFTASDATSTSTPENLLITVTGTNDVPVASAAVNAVDEDASVTGSVVATDADAGETATLTYALTGAAPTGLTFNTDGTYTFDASSYDSLVEGDDLVLSIPFTASDATSTSTPENLVITVTGTNDVPVASAAVNAVDEDASVTGSVVATDADAGETATLTYALTGAAPTGLTFNTDGTYTFDASSYDSLVDGDDLVLTIPFTASDATSTSTPENLVITVTGTNDVPVASAAVNAVDEDASVTGSVVATDADAGETATLTYALTGAAPTGLTFNTDGTYTFDASSYDSLVEGEDLVLTIPFTASDATSTSTPENLLITVTGTNDVPVASAAVNAVDEDASVTGSVVATDADAGETATLTYALTGAAPTGLTFNTDGTYTFDASSYDSLVDGEDLVLSIPFTASDATSTSTPENLLITVTGTNDVPVASAAVNAVDEDASVSGSVVATDADAGETATLTYALTGAAPTGLTFNTDGTYTFDASSYDSLVEGDDLVLSIPFTASDATSTSTPENLLITVTGTNDVPVASAAVNAVDEDASVTGSVVATDADAGETATLTYALTGAAPTGLTFNTDGTYTFDASSYDSLVDGDDLVLSIPFTASDATSTSTPENLVITVTGTNDVPVASAAVNAVDEDASVTGSVVATDADAGETATLTYALTGAAPTGLTFNADGTYTFDASSYDSLVEGEDLVLSIPFTASDATSTSTPENLLITVTGTNDVPVASAAVNAVDEDASVTGSVVATDADAGETATLTYALTGAAPTGLTFNTDGTYTFDASSYDSLVEGEDLVLTIPFTASDATSTSTPENLVITVTGTNDVPVASAAVNAVDEDASVTGSVVATDADAGETATLTYALTGAAPTGLTFNTDGTYTFDASSYDSLVDGEDLVLSIPFTASDATSTSTPENLLITVTGTNDVPVASAAVNAVDEDASVTGSVVATDADAGETATLTYALTGAAPTGLTFNTDGTYTFDASSYDSLVDGDDLVLSIPFTASDATSTSTPENLVITVTGTNDVPVANAAVNAVDEDASVTGSVVATDADAGETATLTYALTGAAPTGLTFNTDGTYTFDASSYDSLVEGEDLVLTIPFTASDATSTSTPENLLITVTGTNDVPVANAAVNAVDEDASVTGSVVATDADAGETATLTYALTGAAPTGLTFNADGTYSFDASSYDSLVEGEDLVLTIPFTASDATSTSTPENLVITVTGTNDVPVASAAVNAVDEDASITGSVVATDADAGETATLTYALTGAAPTGLTFNTDGTYTFDASSYDSLVDGEDLVLSIPFTASDATSTSTPENLLITVTGTNDVPVASAAVNAVDEDASVTGSVVATDADAGETATLTYALTGAAPTGLTFNADGTYTFDASSYDSLVEGEDLVLSIPFTASDATSTSTPENLVITVTGTNDVPVANAAVNAVDEDASVTGSVVATDADAGETATLTYALTGAAPTGLTFNTDGTYTFDASSYDSLVEGEDLVLSIPFTASDATSTSTPENLLITVTGTNDVPVANAAVNAVDEDASVTGSVVATDADAGETATLTYALTGAAPTGLTFNTDGTYTFDASSYDSLVDGEDLVLSIPFTASDATSTSTPENLVITVTGTNDVPVASAAVNAVDEDASVTGSVVATDADAGETATLTYALTGAAPTGLTFNADGTYTFDASSYDSLVEGEDLVLSIPFTASDATSTSTPENLLITVTGTNDVPVASAAVNAVDEDASVTGSVVATDADAGETATLTYALTGAAPTGLTFNTDGTYTFDASSYDSLVEGEDLVLSIPFTASDATSTSTPENLVITVTGTNDVPVASAAVNAVAEDASVSGSVVATDADAGETATLIYALTAAAPTGLVFNADGTYTFDASSYDSLVEGEDLVLTIPFTASDATSTSTPENLVITVTGTNDGPTLSGASTQTVYESGLAEGTSVAPTTTTISGSLSASDIEGDALTIIVNGVSVGTLDGSTSVIGTFTGDYGTLSFNGDGTWDYALSSAVNHEVDLTPFEQFTVKVNDGSLDSPDVSIRVNITDDGLVLSSSSSTFDNTTGVTHVGALPTLGADVTYTADLSANITGWDGTTTTHFDTGMTANGHELLYYVDPGDTATLIAYTDTTGNNPYDATSLTQAKVFEVRAEPNSDQYTVETFGAGNGLIDDTQTMALDVWDDRTDKEVVVVYKTATGNAVAEYDTVAEWMADLPVFDNTIMRLSATSDDGSGNAVADQVHWHEQRIAVDDHSIEGDKDQVLTFDFLSTPVASATFGMQVDSGGYRWTAYDDAGNVLGTGTDTASSVTIGGIGAIARIDLEGMDSSSEFYVDDGFSSITQIVNEQDVGPLSFAVNVADQDGNSASTTIDITLERVAQPGSVALLEDTQRVFTAEDFGFASTETDPLASITIQSLESVGSLQLNGVNVVMGQTVTKAQLDAGELTFDPLPDTGGTTYDSFTFTINNSYGTGSVAAAMIIDVVPVDDGPIGPVTDTDAATNRIALNANIGDVVGLTGLAIDPDPEDTVTYSLINDAGGRFTIDPVTGVVSVAGPLGSSVSTREIEIEALSSDGSVTTAKFDIALVDSADDFATVHESALTDGSGRVETVFDNNDEAGQNTAAGEPTKIATGNLLSNDGTGTSITSIDGNSPSGGVITVTGTHGTLVVTAATGAYTYTLTSQADNSAAADDLAVMETFQYVTNAGTNADLTVTIVDDTPQTGDFITKVPEGQMSEYQLVFTLDVSGSMTGAQYDGVVYLDDGSTTTRLQMAKDALKALVTEYYEQSDAVSVQLVTFSSSAQVLNGGNPYTTLASTLTAIDGMNGSGGTNYEDGLNKMQDALDSNNDGLLDITGSNLQTITYFISDGVPTSGNTANPVGASGWDTFLGANAVDSYAVGIGSGITDFTSLNAIHNVDADSSGAVDEAVYVPDLTTLEEELLSTVPSSFGGSLVLSGAVQNVIFGADGGQIESIAIMLDLDNNGTPETNVTFTYDPDTDVISSGGVFSDISGSILPLDTASYQFVEGKLIFDFSTGDYNYYQSLAVSEGDSFTLTFVANDGDGDSTDPTTVTVQIVDGQPVANDDTDTLFPLGTDLEGNVLSGIGTDGRVSNSSSFTTFSSQGVGVDDTVDNATVTSIVYRGDSIDLTTPTAGTVTATANAGTAEESTYEYTVDASGSLTLTNLTDSSTLTFNTEGYYLYTPSSVPSPATGTRVNEDFNDGTGNGVLLSSPDGTVVYGSNGAGVGGTRLNTGERLEIEFAAATYQYGVQGIQINAQSLGSSYEVFNVTAYHIDGHEMARTSIAGSTTHSVFSDLSGIGHIEIQAGSNTSAFVRAISFDPVQLDASAIAIEPEVIDYTITDEDTPADSDSATLTLKVISNTLVDRLGSDNITGTSGNDFISGLEGDDVLDGGAGHDIVEGGIGNDQLTGGTGDDVLVGGEGVDELFGDAGNDNLSGGAGIDDLHGGDGDDELHGGEGGDNLFGDAGADTLYGDEGNDSLVGGTGNDSLFGGTGDDILTGGAGLDFLSGGKGNDTLTGGAESDVFTWGENDRGTLPSPDQDSITDFTVGNVAAGGDVLDLSDLLQGEESNPLTDYLSISVGDFDTDGDIDTRIAVDADGGIFFQPSLQITLEGVDLSEGGTLTDQDILNNLLTDGNLDTD